MTRTHKFMALAALVVVVFGFVAAIGLQGSRRRREPRGPDPAPAPRLDVPSNSLATPPPANSSEQEGGPKPAPQGQDVQPRTVIRETLDTLSGFSIETMADAMKFATELKRLIPIRKQLYTQPDLLSALLDVFRFERNGVFFSGDVWRLLLSECSDPRVSSIVRDHIENPGGSFRAFDLSELTALYICLPDGRSTSRKAFDLILRSLESERSKIASYALDMISGTVDAEIVPALVKIGSDTEYSGLTFEALCRIDNPEATISALDLVLPDPTKFRFVADRLGPRLDREQADLLAGRIRGSGHAMVYLRALSTASSSALEGVEPIVVSSLRESLRDLGSADFLDACALCSAFAKRMQSPALHGVVTDALELCPGGRAEVFLRAAIDDLAK